MALIIGEGCIGCGACESGCPKGAITQGAGYVVTYVVDPLSCNDCGACVELCPVEVICDDPAWAVCGGRGCPLASRRYEGWSCSEGEPRCRGCGGMLWSDPGGVRTRCPECDASADGSHKAACPKTRLGRRMAAVAQ